MNLSDSAKKKRDYLSELHRLGAKSMEQGWTLKETFRTGFNAGYEVGRDEMNQQVQLLEDALKFYADGSLGDDLEIRPDKKEIWDIPDNWSLRSMSDHWSGKKARQALESLAKMRGEI